tara:strand:+ start:108 stop:848 length:741 start_codon:yes stop_codon:yes gene_type:complete
LFSFFTRTEDPDPENLPYSLDVRRTNRQKTISLEIKKGVVRLLVPKTLSKEKIQEILDRRHSWIEQKLQEDKIKTQNQKRSYREGAILLFRGHEYSLRISPSLQDSRRVICQKNTLWVSCPKTRQGEDLELFIRRRLRQWYLKQAEDRLRLRTRYFESRIGVTHISIKVKDYKSRWGSCSVKGALTYNWRLIMAPDFILDYVVVHELCHILEHNHSKAFWSHVARHFPDFKKARLWLRKEGYTLAF